MPAPKSQARWRISAAAFALGTALCAQAGPDLFASARAAIPAGEPAGAYLRYKLGVAEAAAHYPAAGDDLAAAFHGARSLPALSAFRPDPRALIEQGSVRALAQLDFERALALSRSEGVYRGLCDQLLLGLEQSGRAAEQDRRTPLAGVVSDCQQREGAPPLEGMAALAQDASLAAATRAAMGQSNEGGGPGPGTASTSVLEVPQPGDPAIALAQSDEAALGLAHVHPDRAPELRQLARTDPDAAIQAALAASGREQLQLLAAVADELSENPRQRNAARAASDDAARLLGPRAIEADADSAALLARVLYRTGQPADARRLIAACLDQAAALTVLPAPFFRDGSQLPPLDFDTSAEATVFRAAVSIDAALAADRAQALPASLEKPLVLALVAAAGATP